MTDRINVEELVEDLKNKIDVISSAGQNVDGETLARINEIKQKSIKVLSQASNRIMQITNSAVDNYEVDQALELVKEKSKDLYENALTKINDLVYPQTKKQVKQKTASVKKEINEFFEREEVKNTVEAAKEATVDVAEKAIETLKDWLKPEEK